ncbi:transposase [Fontibacillus phaseoli]|uniref:Transposase n=1 Tax=Fontibacillus phaseoli TaxID=1416533 RepID=A0A369BAM0_9BACL|nr:transposase [Fontibacillus phaseoli]RCX16724.1 transposase [Fontibacillus phaseoli]
MSEKRQSYNETFKREAVRYVQEQTKSLPQIAEELNINPDTLRQWVGKYREFENEPINHGETLRNQSQTIHDQQREIEDLKEEIAILKKAMHIFSKERN